MKAWVLHGVNDICFEEVKEPQLAENEVLVSVKACGICGSDIPRIYETGAHRHPLIPGHEFAGQVEKTGVRVDVKWLGKRVGVFPLIPCRECISCQQHHYELCRNYSYLGSRRNGGFAEYVVVPEWNLMELPDNVPYDVAAMMEPMAVAVHAMRRTMPCRGEAGATAICGLGTIGMLLLMFLIDAGIENILVVGNKESQKQMVMNLGLDKDRYCDSTKQQVPEWIRRSTKGAGAEVFFECAGRNETFSQAVDLTAPGGRICLVGNPSSDMVLDKAVYWKILRNQLTVTGTWNSSFTHQTSDDWNYVLDRLKEKWMIPRAIISHRLRLCDAEQGFKMMREKRESYRKIMVEEDAAV